MNEAKLKRLLHAYFNNTISPADCLELLEYLKTADVGKIEDYISEDLLKLDEGPELKPMQARDIWKQITSDARYTNIAAHVTDNQSLAVKLYRKTWFKVAASLLIFLTVGLIFFNRQFSQPVVGKRYVKHENTAVILPGSTKATLTTANGEVLVLEQAANGLIAKSGNIKVLKTHSGQIVYNLRDQKQLSSIQQVSYNTLTTPKGGEYQVVLADGTKIWLNAASSITYPTAFNGKERRIKLIGEAYFEVAKDARKPFYVNTANGQIMVLGTHFNISAYPDDEVTSTTLLEGAVQVTKNQSSSLLKPGQQASISRGSDYISIAEAKIDEVMAWKNGYFIFDEDNIADIMKKVSRWYDVDVQYHGLINDQKFGGTFHRSKSIVELLHYLEKIGNIHFLITGRRITVTK
ncbi:FecR family protein [uncultured Mucilaginibacter sp.]|uniref:FecR family protein n=1 Tax=uncultured Mucilaginibacter sp. TaxID=797541 RepID=UPI0026200037|nr:FecR family protein [uncultured Mucilaginibacter sp.]